MSLLLLHEPTSSAVGSCVDAIKAEQPQVTQTGLAGCSVTRQVRRPAIFRIVCENAFFLNAFFLNLLLLPCRAAADGRIGFGSGVSYSSPNAEYPRKINVINIGSRAFNTKPFVLMEKWIVTQSVRSIPLTRFKHKAAGKIVRGHSPDWVNSQMR